MVLGEGARPVRGAKVHAELKGVPMGEKIRYVETDVNGFFLIDQLEFGTYYVAAEHEEEGYGDSFVFQRPTVHRYFEPFRHLLAFLPFPGSAGYRSDLLQSVSLWDEEGFARCVTCPCHRAAPTTPLERHVASVSARHAMLPSSVGRRFGFRI